MLVLVLAWAYALTGLASYGPVLTDTVSQLALKDPRVLQVVGDY